LSIAEQRAVGFILAWSLAFLQQIVLSIRSLCSLPTTVYITVRNIIHQVALLPSFTSNLHCCASSCSVPFLQQWGHCLFQFYSNLFEFIWIYSEFICIFEWKKRVQEYLGIWFISAIFPHWSCIHTRRGFHLGLRPFLNPLLILCY